MLDLLGNWENYLHDENDVDPLIRMAVAYYQFEAIHPFTDGTGRTGRVINLLYLIDRELLSAPILYLSRYIIANKAAYYELLLGVTKSGAWEPWILFMLDAVAETSQSTTQKIAAIRKLIDEVAVSGDGSLRPSISSRPSKAHPCRRISSVNCSKSQR